LLKAPGIPNSLTELAIQILVRLDRGLDIFQRFDYNNAFSVAARLQTHRACKPFEVTYLRIE